MASLTPFLKKSNWHNIKKTLRQEKTKQKRRKMPFSYLWNENNHAQVQMKDPKIVKPLKDNLIERAQFISYLDFVAFIKSIKRFLVNSMKGSQFKLINQKQYLFSCVLG